MTRRAAVPLADGVWRIPPSVGDLVNAVAIRDADGSVTLVDPGLRLRFARRRLRAELHALGAAPAGGICYSPGWMCTDPALNRKSADALGDLDFEVVAFMHGPEIRQGARAAVRAFLRGRER